jgi:thioredoxin-related protein
MRILLALLLFALALHASPSVAEKLGYQSDYAKALTLARAQDKPVMLVVVTTYCPWCRKLERRTLASKRVRKAVDKGFVAVIVDRNLQKETFPKKFQAPRIPIVFFVDPQDEEEFWESIGYVDKEEFLGSLKEAEGLFKQRRR